MPWKREASTVPTTATPSAAHEGGQDEGACGESAGDAPDDPPYDGLWMTPCRTQPGRSTQHRPAASSTVPPGPREAGCVGCCG